MKKPVIKFSQLDSEYQNHFYRMYALVILFFVLSVPACILIKKYWYIVGCLIIAIAFGIYFYYQIYLSVTDQVYIFDLECTDIVRQEKSFLGSKDAGSKTCSMTLQTKDGKNFVQSVAFASPYKIGDTVRIYAEKNAVTQLNSNTFSILNPIFMHVLASKPFTNEK